MPSNYFIQREFCPICHSNKILKILSYPYNSPQLQEYLSNFYDPQGKIEQEYLYGVDYSLARCENCSSIFQEYIPSNSLMFKIYEEWISPTIALQNHKKIQEKLKNKYKREIKTIQAAFFKDYSQVKVLDFGMGWGTWAITAQEHSWDCYGLELSPSRIKYAHSKGLKIITEEEDLDEKFDFINTEQVFEHIPDPLETICKLKKWLKPGGIIKVSVPTATNIDERLKLLRWDTRKHSKLSLNPVAPLEHINFYTTKSLKFLGQSAGLSQKTIPIRHYLKNADFQGSLKSKLKASWKPIRINYFKSLNYVFYQKF